MHKWGYQFEANFSKVKYASYTLFTVYLNALIFDLKKMSPYFQVYITFFSKAVTTVKRSQMVNLQIFHAISLYGGVSFLKDF